VLIWRDSFYVSDPPQVQLVLDWVKHNNQISAQVTCSDNLRIIQFEILFQISCHVEAEPVATVKWYKDTLLLEQTDTRRMTTSSSKHILLLSKLGPEGSPNFEIFRKSYYFIFQILATTHVMARIILE
jgi:hypothetical protein